MYARIAIAIAASAAAFATAQAQTSPGGAIGGTGTSSGSGSLGTTGTQGHRDRLPERRPGGGCITRCLPQGAQGRDASKARALLRCSKEQQRVNLAERARLKAIVSRASAVPGSSAGEPIPQKA